MPASFAARLFEIRLGTHPLGIDPIGPQDHAQFSHVPVHHKSDRLALASHAGGTPGAVRIGLGILRQVIIKDMRRMRKIQSAGGDIGRYQELNIQPFEAAEQAGSLVLIQAAVDLLDGFDLAFPEMVVQFVAVVAAGAKQNRLIGLFLFDQLEQLLKTMPRLDHLETVAQGVGGLLVGDQLDHHRVFEILLGQLLDLVGHGGAEQHRMMLVHHAGKDKLDVRQKTLVEHLIGLVQHEIPYFGQSQRGIVQQVDQSSRRSHQDLHTVFQLALLDLHRKAAVDRKGVYMGFLGDPGNFIDILQRQLPRGDQYQCLHLFDLRINGLDHRNGTGSRLSRTGLGQRDQIPPGQDMGKGLLLNRSQVLVTLFL